MSQVQVIVLCDAVQEWSHHTSAGNRGSSLLSNLLNTDREKSPHLVPEQQTGFRCSRDWTLPRQRADTGAIYMLMILSFLIRDIKRLHFSYKGFREELEPWRTCGCESCSSSSSCARSQQEVSLTPQGEGGRRWGDAAGCNTESQSEMWGRDNGQSDCLHVVHRQTGQVRNAYKYTAGRCSCCCWLVTAFTFLHVINLMFLVVLLCLSSVLAWRPGSRPLLKGLGTYILKPQMSWSWWSQSWYSPVLIVSGIGSFHSIQSWLQH